MIKFHQGQVSAQDRQALLRQKPLTLWLTGLSAAGKSTLAFALEARLVKDGYACYVLDGDNIRHGLNNNLGFSPADRSENLRRISEVAKLMNDAGLIVMTSFIAPFVDDREQAKHIIGEDLFYEVYVSTSLEVCEARDPKGLYHKARIGELPEFTGISSPYEIPSNPDIAIDTSQLSMERAVDQLYWLVLDHQKARDLRAVV